MMEVTGDEIDTFINDIVLQDDIVIADLYASTIIPRCSQTIRLITV